MAENECAVLPALQLVNVYKHFGGLMATNNISITVPERSIYGIIGPNGAGKTTLFNIISGVYSRSNGEILLFGESLTGKKIHEISQMGIARTFQNIRLFDELTVFDNLMIACQKTVRYKLWQSFLHTPAFRREERALRKRCTDLLERLGLSHVINQKASNLAYGMQRRVEIARALITQPKILLLDEPAAGMNEEEADNLSRIIKEIRDEYDITILVIDHHMDVIMEVCDIITVVHFGELLMTGTPSEVQRDQAVRDAYLGSDET